MAKLSTSLKKVEKIIPNNVADKLRKKKKITNEAVVPAVVKTEKVAETMLAPYKKLRSKLDEVKGKLGNEKYTKFEGQLKQLPDNVLKKLDNDPDLLEAFAKRSLDDPEFFKAVQNGELSKLDELKGVSKLIKKPTYKLDKVMGDLVYGKKERRQVNNRTLIFREKLLEHLKIQNTLLKGQTKLEKLNLMALILRKMFY